MSVANRYDNKWHFIVGVLKDGNTVFHYFDGVGYKANGTYNTSKSDVDIGFSSKNSEVNHYMYSGDLSDIRIYSEALTDEKVKQLFRYGEEYLNLKD